MIDFNDTQKPVEPKRILDDHQREELRAGLIAGLSSVLATLFPAGKKRRGKFLIGDVLGSPGDSLEVVLDGEKAGLWTDRATGDGGDIYALIGAHLGIDVLNDFPRVLDAAADLLGRSRSLPSRKASKKDVPVDELGPATAKWDYLDAAGHLIAVVYRYDPPGQKKQFRPWDAKRRKMAPPDPRPLYNQPGMTSAAQVVLVEGEKCAQALIDAGIVATTAMHGANAPVDKTDWSPLSGKAVLIWPDRDKPGWEYATQAAQAILSAGAKSCHILYPPEEAAEGWDVADAIAEGFDVATFLTHGPRLQMHDVADDVDPVVSSDESVWGTEDALALSFTRRYHRDWRYVAAWGRWLVWDGQRWRTEDTLAATDLIRSVCRQTAVRADNPKVAAKLASASTVGGVERLARADRRHAATTDEWDADPWLLNTPGGVVDLKTGRKRANDRADRMTKITTATPGGDCPQWMAFLSDIAGGDVDLQAYLQRMVGYCLTGVTSAHALFFLYGTGANGKSVFANVISTILGDYAATASMDTFVETRGDRHPTDLAGLRGARFVTAIETEQGRRLNESKVKAITGGDKISARFMRQDFFEYTPQFKPVIVGNHKPAIRNIDEAMKRRMHMIPFTVTIPPERRDGRLTEKLLAERDGILAWAVAGCLAWQREGLKPPASVVSATEEYFESEDALGRWLDERCVRAPNAKSLTAELFTDWKQWAEAAGEFIGAQRRFSDLLITRGIEKWRNGMGVRGFQGIGLKHPPMPAYTPYADN
ncbi:phage/plasmid primase, P4 family [Extensimonas sp. H3M7-6]|uniref:phage/plasmid primase, P4 family n=1 Tax=Extensimonas soli TaxID=3031322 RepID=UPI0023DC5B7C|nr:phage/plasmid primase, P4 family [Extensimonas sp. H3M7-6]MDF1483253.1 phage/plasmid primase, P4 family [Extensimonas sp. H3M7-6]